MPEPHRTRIPAAASDDGRTARTRAGDARPPRFYDPARGRDEPPEVTAARERHRALTAQIERAREEAAQRKRERGEARAMPQQATGGTP